MVSLLVDVTLVVHFLWILFLVFGFVFALKGSRIAYAHLGGLVFALVLNALGWYCPLTHLEYYFRSLDDTPSAQANSFIARGLEQFVYPDIPENFLRGAEILLTVLYFIVYGYWAKRVGLWGKTEQRCSSSPDSRLRGNDELKQ
ncbi:MAG: DUF2784 domain-containing protein [Desulfobacterota bacterium]|jgi:hypothetical protein|nr:DUF2784 domain-containing protein [Thermodesulfobacteriota bacterium]